MKHQHLATVVPPTVEETGTSSSRYTWNYGTLIVEAILTKVDTSTAEDSAQDTEITALTVRSSDSRTIYVHYYSELPNRALLTDHNFKYLVSGVKELVCLALQDVRSYARVVANELTEALSLLDSGK